MRCFIAIELTKELRQKIADVQQKLAPENLKPVSAGNLHVTLKFLGEIDEKKAGEVAGKLNKLEFQKFTLRVSGVGAFPTERYPRVVWVGCENLELSQLAQKITNALSGMNFEDEKFTGHITIARVKGDVELDKFFEENRDAEFGELAVSEFCLKKSVLGRDGPTYGTVQKFRAKG